MLVTLMIAQLLAADSIYASPSLRAVITRAAERNRLVPEELRSYQARLESEIAIVGRRPEGTEGVFAVEQVEGTVRWRRNGDYEQRITGYRSQSIGLSFSTIGFFRQAWTVPVLYGNRLALFFGRDSARGRSAAARANARPTLFAVHPLATDRERIYRFTGGDTVVVIRTGDRTIPVIRVHVEPRPERAREPTVVFRGEIDLDATRDEIVRMRGYFETIGRRPHGLVDRLRTVPVTSIAFAELENAEFEGRVWLPSYQRFEFQAAVEWLGDSRSAFRIVSRFRGHRLNDSSVVVASSDTLAATVHRLTFAPSDSVSAFRDWRDPLGEATGRVRMDDFEDIAPNDWRHSGPPLFKFRVTHFADLVHYNRVEGAFTGYGAELKLRDAAPGLTFQVAGGWAWAEQAARGRATVEWDRGRWTPFARLARSLDLTNDFRPAFDSGSALTALIWSTDPYDYVDRRSAALGIKRWIGSERTMIVRVETGYAADRYPRARMERGPLFHYDSTFRINRGVAAGHYVHTVATVEWHPDASAELLQPGVGSTLLYDRGDGDLTYQRVEMRVTGRRNWASFTYAARLDGGILVGNAPPPQQLFEIGETQNLPGYSYKQFAGDRAAVGRVLGMYHFGVFEAPVHVWRRYYLPSPAPAVALGIHAGWAEASGDAARAAIKALGTTADPIFGPPGSVLSGNPLSEPTRRIRASVDVGLRFFGGAIGVQYARPIDHRAPWRFELSLAQIL
jgi:hypothetical protein